MSIPRESQGRRPAHSVRASEPRRSNVHIGWLLLLAAPTILTACSTDNPAKPKTYALSGRVRLVSALRNVAGDSTDVQRLEDADSVRVYLYQGASLKDSTRTLAGGYEFRGLSGGSYAVATTLWGGIGDTVAIASLTSDAVLDTLVLGSSPRMIAFPNPFSTATAVRFPLDSNSAVEMIAWKPSGLKVRSLVRGLLPAGYHQVTWDGADDASNPLSSGPYWILFQAGADSRARLVVKN